MKYYIGNTDFEWYTYLKKISPEDINFWQPGGLTNFKAIEKGSPFLLKLKSPINKIAGIGFFSITFQTANWFCMGSISEQKWNARIF